MFEEPNDAKQPVDIFAEVERPPLSGGRPTGTTPLSSVPVRHGPSGILLGLAGLVVFGAIGGGAYWYFVLRSAATPAAVANTPAPVPVPIENTAPAPMVNTTPEPVVNTAPAPTEPVQPPDQQQLPPDADADGLSDADEASAGTNPQAPDTDADGLTDREEVLVYMTDPKNPDTDGDTYLDGAEVKNGYSPKGPGRLFGTPQ